MNTSVCSVVSVCTVIFACLVLMWLAAFAAHRAGRAGLSRGILGCGAILILPFFLFSPPTASLLAGEWLLVGDRDFLVFQTLFVTVCALMLAAALLIGFLSLFGPERENKRRSLCLAALAPSFYGIAYFLPVVAAVVLPGGWWIRAWGGENWRAWRFRWSMEQFLPEVPFVRRLFLVPDPLPGWYSENYSPTLIILCAVQAVFFLIAAWHTDIFRRAFASRAARLGTAGLIVVAFLPLVNVIVLHVLRGSENETLAARRESAPPFRLTFAPARLPVKALAVGAAVAVLCAVLGATALFSRATEVQEADARRFLVVWAEYCDYFVCFVIEPDGGFYRCRITRRNAKDIQAYSAELLNSRRYTADREYVAQLSEARMNRVIALADAAYARGRDGKHHEYEMVRYTESYWDLGEKDFWELTESGDLPDGEYAVSYKGDAREPDYAYYHDDGSPETPELWELLEYVFTELCDGRRLTGWDG